MLLSRKLYYRVFLCFALAFVFFYLTISSNFVIRPEHNYTDRKSIIENTDNNNDSNDGKVKKIVAYSLLKQIEIESVEYPCRDLDLNNAKINDLLGIKKANQGVRIKGEDEKDSVGGFSWKKVDGTELFISSVNVDTRLHPYHYVRIVGAVKGSWKQNQSLYCQIFTNDGSNYVVKPTVTNIWYEKWDFNDSHAYYQPTLVSCRISESSSIIRLSLSTEACNVNPNNLFQLPEVLKKRSSTRNFTICVKPLNFTEDIGNQIIQWFEINKILGAEKFEIYVLSVTSSVWKILNWYSKTYPTTFKVRQFKPLPGEPTPSTAVNQTTNASQNVSFYETWQRRRYEVLTYNHCFYQNLDSKFVIPLDIDELIVPKKHNNWSKLLKSYEQFLHNYSSFTVQNYYFFKTPRKSSSKDVFFLSNNLKTKISNPKGANSKSFIVTNNTLTVFNHYALHSLRPDVTKCFFVSKKVAQLNHYKDSCESVILPECTMYISSQRVLDNIMLKYKQVFMERYKVLKKIISNYLI